MYTLTYSNTFTDRQDVEQTSTNKVLVETKLSGHELVADWNRNSKNHCKGRYRYAVVDLSPATKKETETLQLY